MLGLIKNSFVQTTVNHTEFIYNNIVRPHLE